MARPRSPHLDAKILAASAGAVARLGYAAASIEAIAEAAGVGKTSIYRRWPAKPELMAATYAALVPAEKLNADTGSLAGDLRHTLGRLFAIYRKTPAAKILAGLIAEAQDSPPTRAALSAGIIDGRRDILTGAVARALARAETLISTDPDAVNDLIVAMIWHRLLSGRSGRDGQFIEHIIATIATSTEASQ